MQTNKRIMWIDQLRGFAFFLVVLGHVALPKETKSLIYSFHMPIFFMISGLTINREKLYNRPMKEYVKHQTIHLIIPYMWLSLTCYPIWYLGFRILSDKQQTVSMVLKGSILGNNLIVPSLSNAMWFILVLFIANIMFVGLLKISKNNKSVFFTLIVMCAIIGYLDRDVTQIWHFNVAFTAVAQLYIGNCFMEWYKSGGREKLEGMSWIKYIGVIAVAVAIGYVSHTMNGRISMTGNKFGNSFPLFYVTSIAFSLAFTLVIIKLPKVSVVNYIGQNTLLYIGIHIPILRVFEKIIPNLHTDYKLSIPFAFVLYFGIAILCPIVNKYFPFIVGKISDKNSRAIHICQWLFITWCAAVPYMKVIRKLNIWNPQVIFIVIYGVVLLLITYIVVMLIRKYMPVLFVQEKELS